MRGRLAVAFCVMCAMVAVVVYLMLSTETTRPAVSGTLAPAPPQATPNTAAQTAPSPAQAAAEPALPEAEEDLGVIEDRVSASMDRLPVMERLKLWWFFHGPRMSEDDYERARGLYLRHLDHFARIKTADFTVEEYAVDADGRQVLRAEEHIIMAEPKYRIERTYHEDAQTSGKYLAICDGRRLQCWENGEVVFRGKAYNSGFGGNHLWQTERAMIQEAHPFFLNLYSNCDVEGGRLWGDGFTEMRFDTSTHLIVSERWGKGDTTRTYRYQQVDGLWFPLENSRDSCKDEAGNEIAGRRRVFSHVSLNRAVDEALFDVTRPE